MTRAPVKIGNVVRLHINPGREYSVLHLNGRCGRATVADMGRHKLGIHASRIEARVPWPKIPLGTRFAPLALMIRVNGTRWL